MESAIILLILIFVSWITIKFHEFFFRIFDKILKWILYWVKNHFSKEIKIICSVGEANFGYPQGECYLFLFDDREYILNKRELEKQKIILSELKDLPIIDYEKQQKIKDYIDDLVSALYLNIGLEKLGLNQAEKIKAKCSRNPYYKLVNTQKL